MKNINYLRISSFILTLILIASGLGCQNQKNKNNSNLAQSSRSKVHQVKTNCAGTVIPDRYIVRWKTGRTEAFEIKDRLSLLTLAEEQDDAIDFIEPDQILSLPQPFKATPSDLAFHPAADWGQVMSHAPELWRNNILGQDVVVAIIDSGVDPLHPLLKDQLFTNNQEIPDNNIDDDKNGYIDDIHGFDFFTHTGALSDKSGHGTHVAGIIAADSSKGLLLGMAPKAKILPLNFMSAHGEGSVSDALEAIHYAVDIQKAKIINASWGGENCSQALHKALEELNEKNVLFISAAGNSGLDLDEYPEFPAAFHTNHQITVGAISPRGLLTDFSNYSERLVDLGAPGFLILSTFPNEGAASLSGTSMATPFVSGAAALLMSAYPLASATLIREALLHGVDVDTTLPFISNGRLNVAKSLEYLSSAPTAGGEP